MEYDHEFDRSFMQRTLVVVREYSGPYDATVLLNCLLGLLIVPKESLLERIPTTPLASLAEWGISPESIRRTGSRTKANPGPETLRGVVHNLRNAVAHFRFHPFQRDGVVIGFEFKDRSGFDARIEVAQMRIFVERLAQHLERTPARRLGDGERQREPHEPRLGA